MGRDTWWAAGCGAEGKESACNVGDPASIPGSGRSLEKEMATHSSILAWRTPWTEETGGLQSMVFQRVGHDLAISRSRSYDLLLPHSPLFLNTLSSPNTDKFCGLRVST